MTIIDKACWERGCACYDSRLDSDGVEVVAALEAKDEPVVWGASSISKPEYIAEQKAKTKELRNMMDEFVQTIPNFDQLQQIVNNLERCLTRDSKHEFLRVWIRDWTEHKLSKHTPQQRKPLTDKELNVIGTQWHFNLLEAKDKADLFAFARAIEAAHGITGENT